MTLILAILFLYDLSFEKDQILEMLNRNPHLQNIVDRQKYKR